QNGEKMVFEKGKYVLHSRDVDLKGGKKTTIFFFCTKGKKPKSGKPCDKPANKIVGTNKRTGLPYLKNKK
ncbi:MAG: hypothetical protein U9P44_03465, partial [archaeon]|nr:hypothetical protein [archaeon]